MSRVETFTFITRKNFDFNLDGTLLGLDFEVAPMLGEHQVLYRAGTIHQWQGQGKRKFVYRCLLTEPGVTDRIQAIETATAQEPFGLLIDPRFGLVNAVFTGLKSSEDVEQATNTKSIEVSFAENSLRQVPDDTPSSAAAATKQASTALTAMSTAPAFRAPAAQVDASVLAFQSAVSQIALSPLDLQVALAQVQYATQQMLGLVGTSVENAYLAAQVRLTFATALYAFNLAGGAGAVQVVSRTVSEAMSLCRLCVVLYGGGAADLEDQIAALNRIPNPLLIPGGTQFLVPDPAQVSQVLLGR
jgi:hypothetical protein